MRVMCQLALWTVAMLSTVSALAETRRALLIGINRYEVDPATDRTPDLGGAVSDAEAIAESLRTHHGFQPADIRILKDREATRAAILSAVRGHLIAPAQPGDLGVFFFAGHGSYVENPASLEQDRRDETIVPADTNRGAPDIRDKELVQTLSQILDKQARLVAIIDSCHSGSLYRGLLTNAGGRFAPPRALPDGVRHVPAGAGAPVDLEARGALWLSGAQDRQLAQEMLVHGIPRGRFSSALQQALNVAAPSESAEETFQRIRALMQATGSQQEPVLIAAPERRRRGLFESAAGSSHKRAVVAVLRVNKDVVVLQGGHAVGLGKGAELRWLASTPHAVVRLRVSETPSLLQSEAAVIAGSATEISAGDLFEVETPGAPLLEPLRVFLPERPPSPAAISAALRKLQALNGMRGLRLSSDPTEDPPTHVLHFRPSKWLLTSRDGASCPVGMQVSMPAVRGCLNQSAKTNNDPPVLFVEVPPSRALVDALKKEAAIAHPIVEPSLDPLRADYLLVGRMRDQGPEYAWMLPNADKTSPGSTLPLRTSFQSGNDTNLHALLYVDALQLARLKTWLTIAPPVETERFPYHLRVRNAASKATLGPAEPLREGQVYELLLDAAALPGSGSVTPRYVYVFSLDRDGQSTLLIPGGAIGPGENLFPDPRDRKKPAPPQIALERPLKVQAPFGTDTLVLITSATAISNLEIFDTAPIRRRERSIACTQPLECLIFGINDNLTRSHGQAPVGWSIERMLLRTVAR